MTTPGLRLQRLRGTWLYGTLLLSLGAFAVARNDDDTLIVETSLGGEQKISPSKYAQSGRGGKGREVIKRGSLTRAVVQLPPVPPPLDGAS